MPSQLQGGSGDDGDVPNQPGGLAAAARLPGAGAYHDALGRELTMSWTAPAEGPAPTYYQPVYQRVFDDGANRQVVTSWREWSIGQGVSGTQYALELGLSPDERTNAYDLTVRACNADGCSAYTPTVTVKVDGTPEPEQQQQQEQSGKPGPVGNLSLSAATDSVTVTWEVPASGDAPDRYIVHLKPADGGKG